MLTSYIIHTSCNAQHTFRVKFEILVNWICKFLLVVFSFFVSDCSTVHMLVMWGGFVQHISTHSSLYVCVCVAEEPSTCECDPPCCCLAEETDLSLRCQGLDGCQQRGLKCVSACSPWVISTAHWAECTVLARGHHYCRRVQERCGKCTWIWSTVGLQKQDMTSLSPFSFFFFVMMPLVGFPSGYKNLYVRDHTGTVLPTTNVVKGSFKLSEQSTTHRGLLRILIPHAEKEKPWRHWMQ